MGTKILSVLLALSCLAVWGCASEKGESAAGLVLQGEHQLRKMVERGEEKSQFSGSFFLIFGSVEGNNKRSAVVTFSWKMNDGTYAISSLPIEKFRVRFDESREMPAIKFRWQRCDCSSDLQSLMESKVIYVLVICREKDWPVKINLPLN